MNVFLFSFYIGIVDTIELTKICGREGQKIQNLRMYGRDVAGKKGQIILDHRIIATTKLQKKIQKSQKNEKSKKTKLALVVEFVYFIMYFAMIRKSADRWIWWEGQRGQKMLFDGVCGWEKSLEASCGIGLWWILLARLYEE